MGNYGMGKIGEFVNFILIKQSSEISVTEMLNCSTCHNSYNTLTGYQLTL